MSMHDAGRRPVEIVVQVAVWGQVIGFLSKAGLMAAEDAPSIFARAGIWTFVFPVAAIGAMYLLKLDRLVARATSKGILALFFVLISSLTTISAILAALLAFSIPQPLITPGWRYSQITGLITAGIFALALIGNLILVVRLFQSHADSGSAVLTERRPPK
jgi:hypothetical protein